MIVSNLSDSARYEALHPLFKTLFDYVKSHDLLHEPLGRITLDGDNLFINNVEVVGKTKKQQPLEGHCLYLDVHIVLQGRETIGWKTRQAITELSQDYVAENDCALTTQPCDGYTTLLPGDFMIVYPEDFHAPCIGRGHIRKLVAKVRL